MPEVHQDGKGASRCASCRRGRACAVDAVLGAGLPPHRARPCRRRPRVQGNQELIFDPFFDRGGIDKGLSGILSLAQRVAFGFGIAAIVGIALGTWSGSRYGRCAGWIRCSRCFAPFRRWHGCRCRSPRSGWPALGDLRHLHHLGLADHHQHRGRHPQHPPGLSQRRGRGALNPLEFFSKIMIPAGRPTSSPAFVSASACRGSRSSRQKC